MSQLSNWQQDISPNQIPTNQQNKEKMGDLKPNQMNEFTEDIRGLYRLLKNQNHRIMVNETMIGQRLEHRDPCASWGRMISVSLLRRLVAKGAVATKVWRPREGFIVLIGTYRRCRGWIAMRGAQVQSSSDCASRVSQTQFRDSLDQKPAFARSMPEHQPKWKYRPIPKRKSNGSKENCRQSWAHMTR